MLNAETSSVICIDGQTVRWCAMIRDMATTAPIDAIPDEGTQWRELGRLFGGNRSDNPE